MEIDESISSPLHGPYSPQGPSPQKGPITRSMIREFKKAYIKMTIILKAIKCFSHGLKRTSKYDGFHVKHWYSF